jgi:hypothetical protein
VRRASYAALRGSGVPTNPGKIDLFPHASQLLRRRKRGGRGCNNRHDGDAPRGRGAGIHRHTRHAQDRPWRWCRPGPSWRDVCGEAFANGHSAPAPFGGGQPFDGGITRMRIRHRTFGCANAVHFRLMAESCRTVRFPVSSATLATEGIDSGGNASRTPRLIGHRVFRNPHRSKED